MPALTADERHTLLKLAREAVTCAVREEKLPPLNHATLSQPLRAVGASFVTLTQHGELRGCIGALEAYQPLADDVREHAVSAALQDFRFDPVRPEELRDLHIEVSVLTAPQPLEYTTPEDLLAKLRPGVDGVTLTESRWRRATFLPQVWAQLPDKEQFLEHLCLKMGIGGQDWRKKHLTVHVYQVEEFHE